MNGTEGKSKAATGEMEAEAWVGKECAQAEMV
jgi:hypothetical protein